MEIDEKAMECSFRSLEFVNAIYVGEGAKNPCAETVKNHSFRHKASARQRSPSQKRFTEKTVRHVKANCSNPEKRSI